MTEKAQEIPFEVGEKLILLLNKAGKEIRAISQVVGLRPGGFIIIDEPRFGPDITVDPGTYLACYYSYEGNIFYFQTRLKSNLGESLCLLDYPLKFQKKALRKHQRVSLKIEASVYLIDEQRKLVKSIDDYKSRMFKGTMVDISEGGCRLIVRSFDKIAPNSACHIECTLPDGQKIEGLKSIIISARQIDEFTSEIGLQFLGPMDQIGKIFFFCQLALSIKNPV